MEEQAGGRDDLEARNEQRLQYVPLPKVIHASATRSSNISVVTDVPNPMSHVPGTKMLFGDAKDSCEGALA
jgi:hypothetical protein